MPSLAVIIRPLVVLLLAVGVAVVVLWLRQRHLIYFPSGGPVPEAGTVIAGGRDVTLETSDGLTLGAWFIPARDLDGFTLLVANGNAGDRSSRALLARALADGGFGVLLFDYRGYGGNPGDPTEEGLALDARAAYRFLTEDEQVQPDRLLYYGESLGAAVVTELATEHPPAGLILRSPFTDLASVGQTHYPWLPVGLLLWDDYPVSDHIANLDVPIVVVLGTDDSIVPPTHSRAVAAAAGGRTTVIEIEGANHNDLVLLDGPQLIDAIVGLVHRIEADDQ